MIKPISLAVILKEIQNNHCFLWLQKRVTQDDLHGLWEFPGGKIEAGESSEAALRRELKEETHWEFQGKPVLFKIFPMQRQDNLMHFHTYLITEINGLNTDFGQWFKFEYSNLSNFEGQIPSLSVKMLEEIGIYLSKNYLLYGSH